MTGRILVVGVDAFDPKIFRLLSEQGKLPNFSKLNFSALATTAPPETPVAWSAAATGSNPGKFGIYDFLTRNLPSYKLRLSLLNEKPGLVKTSFENGMRGKPFWRRLTEAGIPVSVLRWPVTFPPEPLKGKQLSGLGVVDLSGTMNRYSFYSEDPIRKEQEGAEKLVVLEAGSQRHETVIKGPNVKKRGQMRSIETPLTLERKGDKVLFKTNLYEKELAKGEWSDIFELRFKVLPLYEVSGIAQALVLSLDPLEVYISSVQINPREPVQEISSPSGYAKELADDIGLFYTLGMAEDTKAVTEDKLPAKFFHEQVLEIEAQRERMFWREYEQFEEGVFALVFDAGDRLKHIFWNDSDPEQGRISPEIEAYYLDKDRFLGQLLEKLRPEDKLLMLSDHGFSNFDYQVGVNRWLAENGHMTLRKGEDVSGLFAGVEWSETSAYAVGFTSLYLNLQGRESAGVVPEEQREAVLNEVVQGLKGLKHKGEPVFTALELGSDLFHGEFAAEAPDLVLGFAPGYRMSWKSAVGAMDEEVISDNESEWNGDHLIDRAHVPGCIFANFEFSNSSPTLFDVAPTILELCGLDVDEEIDGASIL